MDAATFLTIAAGCAPLVNPGTAGAMVATESTFNPHAIGAIAGCLHRQPRKSEKALETAQTFRAQGRNFSVRLAQIKVRNLDRLGLSVADGFDSCKKLQTMQVVCHPGFAQYMLAHAPTNPASKQDTVHRRPTPRPARAYPRQAL